VVENSGIRFRAVLLALAELLPVTRHYVFGNRLLGAHSGCHGVT
jgi:hypothetical protein